MATLPANDPRFNRLPLVATGPWCPEVQDTVDRILNDDRLHLAALLVVAAGTARARGNSNGAARIIRAAARCLRQWRPTT